LAHRPWAGRFFFFFFGFYVVLAPAVLFFLALLLVSILSDFFVIAGPFPLRLPLVFFFFFFLVFSRGGKSGLLPHQDSIASIQVEGRAFPPDPSSSSRDVCLGLRSSPAIGTPPPPRFSAPWPRCRKKGSTRRPRSFTKGSCCSSRVQFDFFFSSADFRPMASFNRCFLRERLAVEVVCFCVPHPPFCALVRLRYCGG